MKIQIVLHRFRGFVMLATLALMAACSPQPVKDTSHCELPDTSNVNRLFADVSERLEYESCHYFYHDYRQRLLLAAKGSPGPENEERFAELLRSTIDNGIISKRQGQEFFSTYFDAEFYVVKSEPRNSCSALRNKSDIYSDMRHELELKREGMLEVLADEARFRQAQRHYSDLHLVLDAVEVACSEDV